MHKHPLKHVCKVCIFLKHGARALWRHIFTLSQKRSDENHHSPKTRTVFDGLWSFSSVLVLFSSDYTVIFVGLWLFSSDSDHFRRTLVSFRRTILCFRRTCCIPWAKTQDIQKALLIRTESALDGLHTTLIQCFPCFKVETDILKITN